MVSETVLIAIRFQEEDRDLLKEVCEKRGEDMSSFIRRAVKRELANLNYYPDATKKALGVKKEV
ncbi:MAG: hypothetical protein KKC03_13760 [Bacteroidetes bacterium]|nr:hypothetical protein [Bacteroidota bacterium]